MLEKISRFIKKYWWRIAKGFFFAVLSVIVLVGAIGLLFIQIQKVGYAFSEVDTRIEVTDKQTEALTRRRCKVQSSDGCAVYDVYTTTRYLIKTPTESFYTNNEIYDNLALGQKANVTVTGWHNSMFPPRRIDAFVEEN